MSMVTLQTGTPPPPAASAPDPLAGVTLLNPDGMSPEAAAKGVRLTPKALKRIRAAMAKPIAKPISQRHLIKMAGIGIIAAVVW